MDEQIFQVTLIYFLQKLQAYLKQIYIRLLNLLKDLLVLNSLL